MPGSIMRMSIWPTLPEKWLIPKLLRYRLLPLLAIFVFAPVRPFPLGATACDDGGLTGRWGGW
jgi:hypothetical protein